MARLGRPPNKTKKSKLLAGNFPPPAAPDDDPLVGTVVAPVTKKPKKHRLTGEDFIVILRLMAKGRKSRTIANLLSTPERPISRAQVFAFMRSTQTPNETVQQALAGLRMRAVESWATAMDTGEKFGKHTPAKDLLQATGTIRSDAPLDRLIIVVGDGTAAVGKLPDIPAEFSAVQECDKLPEKLG